MCFRQVEVPQIQYEDQVVQVPVQKQVQVPHVQTVQKTVEIPQIEPPGMQPFSAQEGCPFRTFWNILELFSGISRPLWP